MWNPFTRRNLFSARRHNSVANLVHSLCNVRIVRGGKDKLTVTESGAILELKRSAAPEQSEGSANFKGPFLVREHYNDYLGCQVYGASYGDTARTLIAKPHTLRLSVTSQTLRGQSIVYTQQNVTEQSRLATSGGYSAVQYITEQYVLGISVIYAAETPTTVVVGGVNLTLIDLNIDGRAWAEYSYA